MNFVILTTIRLLIIAEKVHVFCFYFSGYTYRLSFLYFSCILLLHHFQFSLLFISSLATLRLFRQFKDPRYILMQLARMHTPHPGAFDKDQALSFQQRIHGACACVYFGSFTRLTCVNK